MNTPETSRNGIEHSAIYTGTVRHRRFGPVEREFTYGVDMFYLDLDEIDAVLAGHPLYSRRRRGPASFIRSDFLGPDGRDLAESVRCEVESKTGWKPDGPVRLLTNLRQWGVLANPVSFYYCFDAATSKVRAVVAEVTNTPWGDQQTYVLQAGRPTPEEGHAPTVLRGSFNKAMHVSPLMSMDQVHEIWVGTPGESLSVHISNHEDGEIIFDATLNLRRRSLSRRSMTSTLSGPPMPFKVLAGIYTQAARAWLAGVSFHKRVKPSEVSGHHDLPERAGTGMICPMHTDARSHSGTRTDSQDHPVPGAVR